MKLYFVRHGKTQWNQEMRLQGMYGDSPLLPESYAEITALGNYLKEVPFEACYCSPLLRAKETAEGILKEANQPVVPIFIEELRELGFGQLEGEKISTSKQRFPHEMWALRHQPNEYQPEVFGGESYEGMLSRMTQQVKQMMLETKEGPLLIVSHGAALTGTIQTLIGKSLAHVREQGGLDNNSLTILDYQDSTFHLLSWNETHFL
ncbi:histidine phosphatase family protein [Vagococcus sp.]|uniref:histidine phosphatase family protein n=1 Tax=Vagococcus sp. TaxID=1933889 RepID=UPI003F9C1CC2